MQLCSDTNQRVQTVALYCCTLARAFGEQGRWRDAAACYRQLVLLEPSSAEAWYNFGNALHCQGDLEGAATAYLSALHLAPRSAEILYNLGVTRGRQNRVEEALAAYREALRIRPNYPEAHNNLGNLLHTLGCLEEAAACYRTALRNRPDYIEARYNLAITLQEQEQDHRLLQQALVEHDHLVSVIPGSADAHNNRGNTLLALGRPEEALASFQRALRCHNEHAEARWNLALTELLLGNFQAGWEGYEWRFRQKNAAPRNFHQPLWDGSPFPGRTLLVHAEQGLGDTIQFVRYLEAAKERGGTLVFECQPALVSLLGCVQGVDLLIARGSPLPEFHYHAPLLSLPRIFHTLLDTIPARVPYLSVDPARVQLWGQRIGNHGRRRVGLVWSGSPTNKINRRRSMKLACFSPLAKIPDLAFYSLQCGPQTAELASVPAGFHIANLLQEGSCDIIDTAAILMNLDLLISTDTMPPHLAGALARPVWTLLAAGPDWRWLMNRSDSPWYPSMRLFRQPKAGDWASVIDQLRPSLEEFHPPPE